MSMSLHGPSFDLARKWSATLVETGTHVGGGVLGAVLARFERIYTCDSNPDFVREAIKNMGSQFGRVHYYVGDSVSQLPLMLDAANEKCAILLDAHGEQLDKGGYRASSSFPILEELAIIKSKGRNDHLIMVDDTDQCGTPDFGGITFNEVRDALLAINPKYTFKLRDGVRQAMLLVALPPGFNGD